MSDTPVALQGRWWLPEYEEHQVFATLRWDPVAGGTLDLVDELQPVVWLDNVLQDGSVQKYRADARSIQRAYPLIFGRVEHRAYTLLDSFRLSAREFDMDNRVECVHVNRFLDGAWFDDPGELRIDRVVIEMRHLTGWVNHSGLEVKEPVEPGGFAVIEARRLPSFEIEIDGGAGSLRLTQGLSQAGDHVRELRLTQWWTLRIHQPEAQPLDTFIEIASDFQDLVSIAVGAAAQFENVVMHHPRLPALSLAGTPSAPDLRHDTTLHAQWSNRSAPRDPVKPHEVYFSFDKLGGIDGVGRWLTVAAEYRTELGRVMATRYRAGMLTEDRIMNVCAALDSFDKHRTSETATRYVDRIKRCIKLADWPFCDLVAPHPDEWAKTVKNARHDIAHHLDKLRAAGSVGDHVLAEQIYWLFVICLLRLAEAPNAAYEAIAEHPQFRWLAERTASD